MDSTLAGVGPLPTLYSRGQPSFRTRNLTLPVWTLPHPGYPSLPHRGPPRIDFMYTLPLPLPHPTPYRDVMARSKGPGGSRVPSGVVLGLLSNAEVWTWVS